MTTIDPAIRALSAGQLGIVTRRQVLDAGGTSSAIARRLRSGAWEAPQPGVYAMAGHAWTYRRYLAVAVHSVPTGFASHRAAADLLGVGGFRRPPIELTLPADRRSRRDFSSLARAAGRAVVLHEAEDHPRATTTVVDGIPTADPLRIALDIGYLMRFDRYQQIVGALRREHGVTWAELETTWRIHARKGRNGCGALHELLDRHFGAEGAPSEVIEARCADLLIAAGLPVPEHQFVVRRPDGRLAILDLAYPELKIGIETEGRVHDLTEVRQADHQRRNNLQLLGWTLFHFTWEDIVHRGHHVVNVIRSAIQQAESMVG